MTHTNAESMKTDVGDLRRIAEALAILGARLSDHDASAPFEAITSVAREQLPAEAGASVTTLSDGRFTTVAATEEIRPGVSAVRGDSLARGRCEAVSWGASVPDTDSEGDMTTDGRT